jgi:anti-anti-sigma factor
VDGVVVVRLDAPLFWANATAFEDRLLAEVDGQPGTRALVLDLEATTQLDTTSADVLTHLAGQLEKRGVSLYLARVLYGVNKVLQQSGFGEVVGPDRFWHSISQCVRAARRDTGLKGNGRGTNAKPDRAALTDNGEPEVEQVIEWEQDETSEGNLP